MPTVLTLHTTGMAVLVGASWLLDLRLLGINRNVPLSAYPLGLPAVAIGLIVNLFTGVLLFIKNATTWGTALPFLDQDGVRDRQRRDDPADPQVCVEQRRGQPRRRSASRARLLAIASIVAWTGCRDRGPSARLPGPSAMSRSSS